MGHINNGIIYLYRHIVAYIYAKMGSKNRQKVFEALCKLDIASLIEKPVFEIRPILPCLTRMLLCKSSDKSKG